MLDCLIARNHYDEAFQLYEDTTAMYFREIGMESSGGHEGAAGEDPERQLRRPDDSGPDPGAAGEQ